MTITKWVCAGKCTLLHNKKGVHFFWIDDKGIATDKQWVGERSKFKHVYVGSIHSVEQTSDNSVVLNTMPYVGRYTDTTWLLKWQAFDKQIEIAERREKAFSKDKSLDVLDCLLPLKEAYQSTDRTGKRLLKVMIMEYLEDV